MDCSPPGSSVHGILQAIILEWIAIFFSIRQSMVPSPQTKQFIILFCDCKWCLGSLGEILFFSTQFRWKLWPYFVMYWRSNYRESKHKFKYSRVFGENRVRLMGKQEEDKKKCHEFTENWMVLKGGNIIILHDAERMARDLWRDGIKDVSWKVFKTLKFGKKNMRQMNQAHEIVWAKTWQAETECTWGVPAL